jgi:hypothetical protein
MASLWNTPGIPHKGWTLTNVIDVREDGQSSDETDYEVCMMCGNERIRFVHIVEHPDISETYSVGCVCAEKMTDDYLNPQRRENDLRNKANRRNNWLTRAWKSSIKGNQFINMDGHNVGVFFDSKSKTYKCRVGNKFGSKGYNNIKEAKMALFKNVEYLKEHGGWYY